MDIYMCSVRMYVHATHVQQPCLLSPSALFFFCAPCCCRGWCCLCVARICKNAAKTVRAAK